MTARVVDGKPWTGRMRTAALRPGLVRPAEFSTWAGARRYHERHRRDRQVLEKLRASIPRDGIREPLLLGVRAADRLVFVFEGHHRAVIALELGVRSFPFRWFWDPDVQVVEHEPFPHHALGPDGQEWLCHQEARS
ncbi:ParB N-terminal domain-containing protein (plasmid) [Streptomyces sp. NBC_00637]|uniref:ParB N-terminal domain-containing protein n=1 Tax=Streptomyces sp. NBC_00637 TaxID=2903667 RepID=UPI002F91BDF7